MRCLNCFPHIDNTFAMNQTAQLSEFGWYALYTMPRAEKKVQERLLRHGMEVFLPTITTLKMWSDRKKKVTLPLLPGFIFVKIHSSDFSALKFIQGVLGPVKYLGKPALIREDEIGTLQKLMEEPDYVKAADLMDLSMGERVEIIKGPLKGIFGHYIRTQGRYRVVVELEALGRMIEVNVCLSFLQKTGLRVA